MPDFELPDLEVHERIKGHQWVITDGEKNILFICHVKDERGERLTKALVAAVSQ